MTPHPHCRMGPHQWLRHAPWDQAWQRVRHNGALQCNAGLLPHPPTGTLQDTARRRRCPVSS